MAAPPDRRFHRNDRAGLQRPSADPPSDWLEQVARWGQWDYRRAAFERMAQRSPRCSPAASNRYRKQLGFVQVKAEADLFAGKGR